MIFWAQRSGDNLVPDGAESFAEFAKLPVRKLLRVEVRYARSGPQHRLYWELCRRIAHAVGAEPENVSDLLKIETGHCSVIHSKTYGELRLPRSISFAGMEQVAFNEFFEKCVNVICNTWGMQKKEVLAAVEDVLIPQEKR